MSFGQTQFAPTGAQWVYYLPPDGGPFYPETEEVTTVVSDTIILGIQAKKLITEGRTIDHFSGGVESAFSKERYVAIRNDSILFYQNQQWNLVFDLGVTLNDSIVIYLDEFQDVGCELADTIVITDLSDTTIYGEDFQRYSFKLLVNDWFHPNIEITGEFIERLGFKELFPVENPFYCYSPIAGYWPPQLYCYSDSEITVSPSAGCGQILSVGSYVNELVRVQYINDNVSVENAPNSTLHIYDILGKELFQERITSDNQTFDLNGLPNGILLVSVENESGRFTKKVVKTSY